MNINIDNVQKVSLSEIEIQHFGNNETFHHRCIDIVTNEGKVLIILTGRDLRLGGEKDGQVKGE